MEIVVEFVDDREASRAQHAHEVEDIRPDLPLDDEDLCLWDARVIRSSNQRDIVPSGSERSVRQQDPIRSAPCIIGRGRRDSQTQNRRERLQGEPLPTIVYDTPTKAVPIQTYGEDMTVQPGVPMKFAISPISSRMP